MAIAIATQHRGGFGFGYSFEPNPLFGLGSKLKVRSPVMWSAVLPEVA
jgi:hypothetical protein